MLIIAKYIKGNKFGIDSVFMGQHILSIETSKTYGLSRGYFYLIKVKCWKIVGEKLIIKEQYIKYL